ncbi:unnamed protein product (macronuclear) [Paramecium tetraurelia]|uniref:Myb-like DNA-binding domain protein n=1 Tax=Paramecium tetraurelia TaxID=5888 RepID=A0CM52_PARTE|nr:uncharacterized protein GSPATT00008348001 [Paramecium tetraurelia]CAK71869.1 unnamed protein product [Paramecium tetraurelia]|eukprot:XP_001439266.1 hypothetical protein (macronuclear) [Paramecium tetraurelia strain d4-2]
MQSKQSETRQSWSYQEDKLLLELIKLYGCTSWNHIALELQSQGKNPLKVRSPAACRERYQNILNPNLNKSNWTLEEETNLFNLQQSFGNCWARIASQMPGRSDLLCKNYFYATLRKVLRRLSKAVGLDQSSDVLKQVKPSVLGIIYSKEDSFKIFNIEDKVKKEFQQLIKQYRFTEKAELRQLQENDLNYIKSMLNQLFVINNNYVTQKERNFRRKNSKQENCSVENNSKSTIPNGSNVQNQKNSKLESKLLNATNFKLDSHEEYNQPKNSDQQDNQSIQVYENLNQPHSDFILMNQSQGSFYAPQPVFTFCIQQNFISWPIQSVQPYYTPQYLTYPQSHPLMRYEFLQMM